MYGNGIDDLVNLDKWQTTVDLLAELYGADAASIVRFEDTVFKVLRTSGQSNKLDIEGHKFSSQINSYCKFIMENRTSLYVENAFETEKWDSAPPCKAGVISYLGFPLIRPDNSFFGTICVKSSKAMEYSNIFVKALEQFRDLIQADLELAAKNLLLEKMAFTDSITGCGNRRGLVKYCENELNSNIEIALLYFDLDNLKITNDTKGHDVGDFAITSLAQILKENSRQHDYVSRVGGDEFVVILQACEQDANSFCERITAGYDKLKALNEDLHLTSVSYGMSVLANTRPFNLEAMIHEADHMMYQMKSTRG